MKLAVKSLFARIERMSCTYCGGCVDVCSSGKEELHEFYFSALTCGHENTDSILIYRVVTERDESEKRREHIPRA